MNGGEEVARGLVVPGGDAAPLLEEVEGLLDGGPPLVGPGVERLRTRTLGLSSQSMKVTRVVENQSRKR